MQIDRNRLRYGDKIKALVTTDRLRENEVGFFWGDDAGHPGCIVLTTNPNNSISDRIYGVSSWELLSLADSDDDVTPVHVQVLERKIREQSKRMEELRTNRDSLLSVLSIVNDRMVSEAQSRGWCEEFDEIIRELNERIGSTYELVGCETDYQVTMTGHLMIPFSYEVTVTARSTDDAQQIVEDDPFTHLPDLNDVMDDSLRWADIEVIGNEFEVEVTG